MTDRRRLGVRDGLAALVAIGVGSCIGYVDSRATWDDAGITAAALLAAAGLIGFARPRAWWLVGLATGVPVLAFNVAIYGTFGSAIAIAFSLGGAAVGASMRRMLRGAVA
jgi:hypothetical protein